jgi:uncharacterized membrane protein
MPAWRFGIILLVLVLFSLAPVQGKDYSLEASSIEMVVKPDGVVHVSESITYIFSGTFREVFRQIAPPPGGSIENMVVTCEPQSCEGRIDKIAEGYEMVGVLPRPTPEGITFIMEYDYYGGLKVYDDTSELHYKLWGEAWEKDLNSMVAVIHLPDEAGLTAQYWLHPPAFTETHHLDGNVIKIETRTIPSNSWYEIRAVFPRIESPNPEKVAIQSGPGLERIMEIEERYGRDQSRADNLYRLIWLLAAVFVAIPFYIYRRFGREPEIGYYAIYEREPPSKSKPAAVNAIIKGAVGKPDINAFVATIMDLVYREYIGLKDVKVERSYFGLINRTEDDVVLELKKKGKGELFDFESDVLNFLRTYSKKGRLSWLDFKDELGNDDRFYNFINSWNKLIQRHIKVERLFISTGNYFLMAAGLVSIFISIFGAIGILNFYPPTKFPGISRAVIPGAIIFIVGLGSLLIAIINEKGAGRFTPEGRLYYERWIRFRDYLTDFSALKEHPPESIKLWDFYLVYGITLGVTKKVIKNMGLIVPKNQMTSSTFYAFHYDPIFFSGFNRAYHSSNPTKSSGGMGGVGGVGGGFGGGGGGAR